MPLLDAFPTFTNGSTMVAVDVGDVFLNTVTEGGLYNVLHEIDTDNLSGAIPERLIQFNPYRGHDHQLDDPTTGSDLSGPSTKNFDRSRFSGVYSGAYMMNMNCGQVIVTVANQTIGGVDYGNFGHADISIPSGGVHSGDPFVSDSLPSVVASATSTSLDDQIHVWAFPLGFPSPNISVRIWVASRTFLGALTVNWVSVGITETL